jgi:hypothetical protein
VIYATGINVIFHKLKKTPLDGFVAALLSACIRHIGSSSLQAGYRQKAVCINVLRKRKIHSSGLVLPERRKEN